MAKSQSSECEDSPKQPTRRARGVGAALVKGRLDHQRRIDLSNPHGKQHRGQVAMSPDGTVCLGRSELTELEVADGLNGVLPRTAYLDSCLLRLCVAGICVILGQYARRVLGS